MEINVDIGGTFTDCFAIDGEQTFAAKALTTHHELAVGFLRGLDEIAGMLDTSLEETLRRTATIRYATTLGTNALIERTGPRLGLITTGGHESVVPVGRCRQWGDGLPVTEHRSYLTAQRPKPLVEPEWIVGVSERVNYRGEVLIPLDEEEVREKVQQLVDRGVRGFVIALLHANHNPAHERRIREIIAQEYPPTYLGRFPVVISSDVSGRSGEYLRSMTSIIDAYLHRFTSDRLSRLRDDLRSRGYAGQLLLVHNSGGMGSLSRSTPLNTVHAGPVSGLFGAGHLAESFGYDKIITTDMGGTSFDVGIVVQGSVRFYEFNPVIDRWRVQIPMISMKAIGAGGGSIAGVDPVTGVFVGPRSAGSTPGPACYGQGGSEPTVTDANLVLGYLDSASYHGGELPLEKARAERAIERKVAKPLGTDVVQAARAIRKVVDEKMGDEIFKEITLKGYDPREFTIFSYGGGGPMHACGYAEALKVRRIVVPPNPQVFSASGAAGLQLLRIYEQSAWFVLFNPITKQLFNDFDAFNAIVEDFEERARADFADEGYAAEALSFSLELDMRSSGQLYVITIASPVRRIRDEDDLATVVRSFFDEYSDRFGDLALTREVGVSIDAVRLRAWVPRERWEVHELPAAQRPVDAASKGTRSCWWDPDGYRDTPVFDYAALEPGHVIGGPAIVESRDTTVLIGPAWKGRMDTYGFFTLDEEQQPS
jgi:N-methylhydantoinase A